MLPFFFAYYDRFVDRYIVFDDGSTDGSIELLTAHPKVDLRRRAPYEDPDSIVASGLAVFNNAWKESRGRADWVIFTDIDEHLVHERGLDVYLDRCAALGVTLIPALGFQMVSETFPVFRPGIQLQREFTQGVPWVQMNKLSVFSPDAIEETNYAPGRHTATPVGRLLLPPSDELRLLHYKYMGRAETQTRHEAFRERLRARDLANGWGHKYMWSAEDLSKDWDAMAARLVDVANLRPDDLLAIPRWWSGLDRAVETGPDRGDRPEGETEMTGDRIAISPI